MQESADLRFDYLNSRHDETLATSNSGNIDVRNGKKLSPVKKLISTKLFEGAREVVIDHHNETYFLRITKQNKLILTK